MLEAKSGNSDLTFNQKAASAACYTKLVPGSTRVKSSIHFGNIGNPKAPTFQHSDSV